MQSQRGELSRCDGKTSRTAHLQEVAACHGIPIVFVVVLVTVIEAGQIEHEHEQDDEDEDDSMTDCSGFMDRYAACSVFR
jgi:hypothetical protein